MNRSTLLFVIALLLAGYGIWTTLYIPAMLVGPPEPFLFVGFVLQAVSAVLAAVGIARRRPWAAIAVLVLGAAIAGTQLVEIALGIVPYLRALLIAVLAVIGALVLAGYIRRSALEGTAPSAPS